MGVLFFLLLVGAISSFWPLLIVAVLLYLIDSRTVGFWQRFRYRRHRSRELRRLERRLARQPADKDARYKLADVLVEKGHHQKAIEVLKPLVADGDHSSATLLLLGRACIGAGNFGPAETLLTEAKETDPRFARGALDLALGELYLASNRPEQAVQALETYCVGSPGSVEGYLLLSSAYAKRGDAEAARRARTQAMTNFRVAPAFIRKHDRLVIWRLQPWRPLVFVPLTVLVTFVVCLGGYLLLSFGWDSAVRAGMKTDPIGEEVPLSPAAAPLAQHLAAFDLTADGIQESELRQLNFTMASVFEQFRAIANAPLLMASDGRLKGRCEAKDPGQASTALRALEFVSLLSPHVTFTIQLPRLAPAKLAQGHWADVTIERLMARDTPSSRMLEFMGNSEDVVFAVHPTEGAQPLGARLRERFAQASHDGLLPAAVEKIWVGVKKGFVFVQAQCGGHAPGELAVLDVLRRSVCTAEECLPPIRLTGFSLGDDRIADIIRNRDDSVAPVSHWITEEVVRAGIYAMAMTGTLPRAPRGIGQWPEAASVLRGERVGWFSEVTTQPGETLQGRAPARFEEKAFDALFLLKPDGTLIEGDVTADSHVALTLERGEGKKSTSVRNTRTGERMPLSIDGDKCDLLGAYQDGAVMAEETIHLLPPSQDTSIAVFGKEGLRFRSPRVRRSMMTVCRPFLWSRDRVVIPDQDATLDVLSLADHSMKPYEVSSSGGGFWWVHEAGDNHLVALVTPKLMANPTQEQSSIVALDTTTGKTVRHTVEQSSLWTFVAVVGDDVWLARREPSGVASFSIKTGEWRMSVSIPGLPAGASVQWAVQENGHLVVGMEKEGVYVVDGETTWLAYRPQEGERVAATVSRTGAAAIVVWNASQARLILARQDGARAELALPLGPVAPVWIGEPASP